MGAWIEMTTTVLTTARPSVAPHVGAWIEIDIPLEISLPFVVAPHVGAWIEIKRQIYADKGLQSHPTWVRGLKFRITPALEDCSEVAPHVGAWIEIDGAAKKDLSFRRTPRGCVD